MSSSQYLIPKDPPSYESIYHTLPPQTSLETQESRLSKASFAIRRFFRRHSPFLQTITAAVFVAATVSATVMLLLWQLQNLASPPEVDDPWLDLEFATS